MADEVEIKMKAADIGAVRDRLRTVGANARGKRFEVNAFFDTADAALKARGDGLRLRTMRDDAGNTSAVITYKGPAKGEDVRRREEIEFSVGDVDAAAMLLDRLGYSLRLSFEKRRESWELDDCLVELDTVPHLGTFVEIEGNDEAAVNAVRKKIGLEFEPAILRGYASMIGTLIEQDRSIGPRVTFDKSS